MGWNGMGFGVVMDIEANKIEGLGFEGCREGAFWRYLETWWTLSLGSKGGKLYDMLRLQETRV